MVNVVDRFPVERLYIWAGLMSVIAVSVIVTGAGSLLTGNGGLADWMLIAGGAMILVGVGYDVRTHDPAEFSRNGLWIGILAVAALLVVGGSVLTIAGLF